MDTVVIEPLQEEARGVMIRERDSRRARRRADNLDSKDSLETDPLQLVDDAKVVTEVRDCDPLQLVFKLYS